jgi:beta-glucanase (GH16 family)
MHVKRSSHLAATVLLACAAAAVSPTPASAVTKSCGSAQVAKPGGGHWVCTFGDNFNGTVLHRRNWQVMTTATMGFSQVGECYVDDPSHVRVGGGVLTLTATKLSSPRPCGRIKSDYESGMIFTKDLFAQAYGRFKVRAKLPRGVGFHSAFWM